MFRAILYALVSIFAITFLRMVMGIISRGFSDMMKEDKASNVPPTTGGQRPPTAHFPTSGEFKPCQKCGTYVVASQALAVKSKSGESVYFCSDKCKSEYQAA